MAIWKILTVVCTVFVYAESKWNNHRENENNSTICDTMQNNTNKVQCYCEKLPHHPTRIGTAECYQVHKNITMEDETWEKFSALQNISRLTLTNTRGVTINYIPTKALEYTKAILRLDVKYCSIEKIGPFAFANLSLVEEMTLRDNQISILEPNAFSHHARLKSLSLDQNNIAEINRNVFVDLPSLEQLFLTANRINTIHDQAFIHLGNLKELEIDKNSIFSLNSDTFAGLRNLEKLELSGNALEVVGDNTFAPLGSLRFLNLDNNRIQMLDEKAFRGLARLQVLSLEHNKLSALENEKIFDGLESLTSFSLKDNVIATIKTEAFIPILGNFYGKSSLLNLEGNKFQCSCTLDVFRPLLNRTQNSRLNIDIQNLQCYPDDEVKQKWDKIQENTKINSQLFDETDPPAKENTDYEYYDESELNGTLFYFDMRYILNCSGDETTSSVPETKLMSTTSVNTMSVSVTSSPILNIISTTSQPSSKEYPVQLNPEVTHKGNLDLSEEDVTAKTKENKSKNVHNAIDNNNDVTNVKFYNSKHELGNSRKENVYTTSRLATVSAKPIDTKMYDDREMASDEALPDRMKAHRSIQTEEEKSPLNNGSHKDTECLPLFAFIVFGLSLFL